MYVMTANCKIAFAVAEDKTREFKEQKCSKKVIDKINMASVKLQKNLKDSTIKSGNT